MADRRVLIGPFPDRLDRIARTAYGTERGGTVEALLSANPALAAAVVEVPVGTVIVVPAKVEAEDTTTVRPWI